MFVAPRFIMLILVLLQAVPSIAEMKGEIISTSSKIRNGIAILELTNDCHHYEITVSSKCIEQMKTKMVEVNLVRRSLNLECLKKKTLDLAIDLKPVSCVPDMLIVKLDEKTVRIHLDQ